MLKQLILSRKIQECRDALAELDVSFAGLRERRDALNKREEEITAALNEVTPETTAEDKAAIDGMATEWSEADDALRAEEDDAQTKRENLEANIATLTKELEELNARAVKAPAPVKNERKEMIDMNTRKFFGMTHEERSAFFADDGVKTFLGNVRTAIREKRAVSNVGLTIPQTMLPLIEQVLESNSKLLPYVNVQDLQGTGRVRVMGDIPEAVWTEMCAKLNELSLGFSMVEVDGFKVGGFVAMCNAVLEDNDAQLATKIIDAIGKAIALAVDKAIIFGTGTKMPLGIYTRLAQTAAPDDADPTERTWVDLHTKNIKTIASSKTGAALYQDLIKYAAITSNKYAKGNRFWAMSQTTYSNLQAEMLTINAAGSIVTGQSMTLPVIGGNVVILDFMPENMIVGGYGESYLVARRAGVQFATSTEYRFVEDQTVFKGTMRIDGKPVIAESFVAIGVGSAPSASGITFAADAANAG